jgi:hypothetical protein
MHVHVPRPFERPYARERTIEHGIINDTFETAITWERFESFHDKVKAATEHAIVEATGRVGQVTCRCPCLSGRASALFHLPRRRTPWRVDRSMAHNQVGRSRCCNWQRGDRHAPSCGRAGPSEVVRSPAPIVVRGCPEGRQGNHGPAGPAQSGSADRSVTNGLRSRHEWGP